MGEEALRMVRTRGGAIPENVFHLRPEPTSKLVKRSPELALIAAIFCAFTDEQKAAVRQNLYIGSVAYPNDESFKSALALLEGRR
jgi:hypothetical protein